MKKILQCFSMFLALTIVVGMFLSFTEEVVYADRTISRPVTHVLGNGTSTNTVNGDFTKAENIALPNNGILSMAVDSTGNLYFIYSSTQERIYSVTPAGIISVFAGQGNFGDEIPVEHNTINEGGTAETGNIASEIILKKPGFVSIGNNDELYVMESYVNDTFLKIDTETNIVTKYDDIDTSAVDSIYGEYTSSAYVVDMTVKGTDVYFMYRSTSTHGGVWHKIVLKYDTLTNATTVVVPHTVIEESIINSGNSYSVDKIDVDSKGRVLLSSDRGRSLYRYTPSLSSIEKIAGKTSSSGSNNNVVGTAFITDPSRFNPLDFYFQGIADIAVDHADNIYLTNRDFNNPTYGNQILKINGETALISRFAGSFNGSYHGLMGNFNASSNDYPISTPITITVKPIDGTVYYNTGGYGREANLNGQTVRGLNAIRKIEFEYKVNYHLNGGNGTVPTESTIKSGQTMTLASSSGLTREEHTFKEWNTKADGSGQSYTPNDSFVLNYSPGNIDYYAIWDVNKYMTTYNVSGNGSLSYEANVDQSEAIFEGYAFNSQLPQIVATPAIGHAFVGWVVDGEIVSRENVRLDSVLGGTDRVYTAVFAEVSTVNFNLNEGEGESSLVLAIGTDMNTIIPTREGYRFMGWYTESELTTKYDTLQSDVTLYAKWHLQYPYVLVYGNGELDGVEFILEGDIPVIPVPEKTGYTFTGWYVESDLTNLIDDSPATQEMTLYAGWEINSYAVNFDTNDGSEVAVVEVNYNNVIHEANAVSTRYGYDLIGWYTDANFTAGSEFDLNTTPVTEDITLYAKWELKNYSVSFESNGGVAISAKTVAHNSTIDFSGIVPTKVGYTFVAWYEDALLTDVFNEGTQVQNHLTLYAEWEINDYTVTFNTNGGTEVSEQKVTYNTLIPTTVNTTKATYTFVGWYTTAGFTTGTEFYFGSSLVTDNVTLFAKWELNKYSVNFELNGGTGEESIEVSHGSMVNLDIVAQEKTGYTFVAWYIDEALENEFDSETFIIENMTLFAAWDINSYDVEFVVNGGTEVVEQTVVYNTQTAAVETEKTGHTFAGWYTTENFATGTEFDIATDTIKGTTTLYAKWTINSYDVTFETNGGLTIVTAAADYNTQVSLGTTTKTGHTFAGWYTDEALKNEFISTTPITEDITLFAAWDINSYDVTFETNNGTTVAKQTVVYDKELTEEATTRAGYTFAGWYTDATFAQGTEFDFDTDTIKETTTLYAKWTINSYDVTFETNGGLTIVTAAADYNTQVNLGTTTKTGHTFAGWYTDEALENEFISTTPITEDITLFAAWDINSYDVTFETNDGTAVSKQTVVYDMKIAAVTTTRAGYTFAGWYTNEEMTTVFNTNTPITADVTVYAKWNVIYTPPVVITPILPTPTPEAAKDPIVSDNGNITVPVGETGVVSVDNVITVNIPAGAAEEELIITIEKVAEVTSLISEGETLVSDVFELLKNVSSDFTNPVTLTFNFDVSQVGESQTVAIFYYDEVDKVWVEVGGIVDGNVVTVDVDHFTKFAVFVVDKNPEVVISDLSGHWAEVAIKEAVKSGITNGYADGSFKPNATITRAEFSVMLSRALKLQQADMTANFVDSSHIAGWAKQSIVNAIHAGIIKGYDNNTFRPNAQISRAELAVMIARALSQPETASINSSFADEQAIPTWAKQPVAYIKQLGLINGKQNNHFAPSESATRAEAVTMLLNLVNHLKK